MLHMVYIYNSDNASIVIPLHLEKNTFRILKFQFKSTVNNSFYCTACTRRCEEIEEHIRLFAQ